MITQKVIDEFSRNFGRVDIIFGVIWVQVIITSNWRTKVSSELCHAIYNSSDFTCCNI